LDRQRAYYSESESWLIRHGWYEVRDSHGYWLHSCVDFGEYPMRAREAVQVTKIVMMKYSKYAPDMVSVNGLKRWLNAEGPD